MAMDDSDRLADSFDNSREFPDELLFFFRSVQLGVGFREGREIGGILVRKLCLVLTGLEIAITPWVNLPLGELPQNIRCRQVIDWLIFNSLHWVRILHAGLSVFTRFLRNQIVARVSRDDLHVFRWTEGNLHEQEIVHF